MRREILNVTENDIIWNGLAFRIYSPSNNFRFKAYSCMHDELVSGAVNNNFLNMSIDDVQRKNYERFDESLAIKTAPLTITEYSDRIFWGTPLQRPADYIEDLRNILGFSYDAVMAEMRDLMDGLGLNPRNISKTTGMKKFRMNVLGNMYPCENSWDRIIRIHEFYTDEFQYQFDLVQTIKTSEKKSYKRTGFILDGYEMISIEEYSYQRDGEEYTMIYKTDHRKTHSREFLALYTGSKVIDVFRFIKRGISYTGGPEAVFNAYKEYITTSTSENDEEDKWASLID